MIDKIKQLREDTGVGMMECKKALLQCNNDIEKAKVYLRKQGVIKASDRGHRVASEGTIGVYKHTGGRICAIVEVNCETDFVAKNEEFQGFAHDVAIHVAASNPQWMTRDDVPQDVINREKDILSVGLEKKPSEVREKILEGKLSKFFKDNCLMEQSFVKDPKVSIQDIFNDLVIKFKENIIIKRFTRFQVGE